MHDIERIEFPGALHGGAGFVVAAGVGQDDAEHAMSEGKVGVERDASAVGGFCGGPVPAEPEVEVTKGGLDLGEVGFCVDGVGDRITGVLHDEEGRDVAVNGGGGVTIGETGPGERVFGIQRGGVSEEFDGATCRLAGELIRDIPPVQMEVVGLWVLRLPIDECGEADGGEAKADLLRNGDAEFALEGEEAAGLTIVGGGPDLELVVDANEFGGDAKATAFSSEGALDEIGGIELAADLRECLDGALVAHDGGAADDAEVLGVDLADGGDGLFGKAVGEVLALRTGTEVFEGEDSDPDVSGGLLRGGDFEGANLCGETVACAGDGSDVAVLAARLSEDAAKGGDVLVEIVLFDGGIGPDGAHELPLVEHLTLVGDEKEQGVEDLGREGDLVAGAEEKALAGVDAEVSEVVGVRLGFAQVEGPPGSLEDRRSEHFRNFQRGLRTSDVAEESIGPIPTGSSVNAGTRGGCMRVTTSPLS